MKKENGFINYIAAIIIVLVVAFLSQQPNFREFGTNIYGQAESQVRSLYERASGWVMATIYPKINSEVEKRGQAIEGELNQQKNNLMQNAWDNIKNYFADIFSKTTGSS